MKLIRKPNPKCSECKAYLVYDKLDTYHHAPEGVKLWFCRNCGAKFEENDKTK